MNSKARFICWLQGHDVRTHTAVIKEDKKYHGHATKRQYGKCVRCGKGTLEGELRYGKDSKNLYERHETITFIVCAIVVILAIGVAITLIVGLGALIGLPLSKYMCQVNGAEMGLVAKYNYWTGCYFNVKGVWVADELLSVVDLLK